MNKGNLYRFNTSDSIYTYLSMNTSVPAAGACGRRFLPISSTTFRLTAEGMRDIIDTDKTTFSARPAAKLEIIIKNWK